MDNNQNRNFSGFQFQTLDFLSNLVLNNNRTWFNENKYNYQQYILKPLECLVSDLSLSMLEIDPLLEVTPSVNKTISRIYRDTRFSKNKNPYKDSVWVTFKRPGREWSDVPSFFFEIFPDRYSYGMGFYCASRKTMENFRKAIDKEPQEFLKSISFFEKQKIFSLRGEMYKKILDQSKSSEVNNWYQRKNFYLTNTRSIDATFFKPELVDILVQGFTLISPIYKYLCNIKYTEE